MIIQSILTVTYLSTLSYPATGSQSAIDDKLLAGLDFRNLFDIQLPDVIGPMLPPILTFPLKQFPLYHLSG